MVKYGYMKITKYDQSCIIIEKNDHNLVIDPVEFSTKIPDINNIDAIIITHKHSDHFQPEIVEKLFKSNQDTKLIIAEDMTSEINLPAQVAQIGENIQIGEFNLSFFGKDHAPIVDNISPCKNFGVIIDNNIINPGDSFDNPKIDGTKILFVPISAPWLKVEESMKYISDIKPIKVIPNHDVLLSPLGHKITDNWIQKACDNSGAEYINLNPGESVNI